jgi:hypothetical protein
VVIDEISICCFGHELLCSVSLEASFTGGDMGGLYRTDLIESESLV